MLADAHGNQIVADRSEITIWGVMVDD
jgi:hypothetical protein